MDPVTHSLVGAALSRAGLRRAAPLATATLVVAANAPDIDVLIFARGEYASLAFRRGVTHGPVALLVLPLLVTAVVLGFDRLWRRRRDRTAEPARAGPLLGLASLGVLTHAPLDWLNTYGVRLLSPIDTRWFYGDALFIIDPWVWLILAAVVVVHTQSRRGWTLWFALAFVSSGLVLLTPEVPVGAKVVWSLGVAAVAALAVLARRGRLVPGEVSARVALGAVAIYIAAMTGADLVGQRVVTDAARAGGMEVEAVMVAPSPANPFASDVVVQTPTAYQLGALHWLASPRVRWSGTIPQGQRTPVVLETLLLPEVRDFLRWSRFPFVQAGSDAAGAYVRWGDARYPGRMRGGLGGITVRIDPATPAPAPDR